jgi:hypothetical protein
MRVDILTNTQPILASDVITIAIRPDGWDWSTMWYSLNLVSPRKTIVSVLTPFNLEYDWTVDEVGTQLVVEAVAHGAFGLASHSDFSDPFLVLPDPPKVTAPTDGQVLSAGNAFEFQWTQNPPNPDSYRLFFSPDGGQTFDVLGADVPGSHRSVSREIPAQPTDNGQVVVQGMTAGFPGSHREATSVTTVSGPVLAVTRPTAGALWHIDSDATVEWSVDGSFDHFEVDLSRDGGQTWATIASNLGGSVRQFTVGVDPPQSQHARVRVKGTGPAGSRAAESGTFRIQLAHVGRHPRD